MARRNLWPTLGWIIETLSKQSGRIRRLRHITAVGQRVVMLRSQSLREDIRCDSKSSAVAHSHYAGRSGHLRGRSERPLCMLRRHRKTCTAQLQDAAAREAAFRVLDSALDPVGSSRANPFRTISQVTLCEFCPVCRPSMSENSSTISGKRQRSRNRRDTTRF